MSNEQPQSRSLTWCQCSSNGACLGCLIEISVRRDFGSQGVEYLKAALQSASSETGPSEEVAELKATIERMRKRIMGNLADLQIGDYVEVRFKDGSGRLKGNITKLWPEHGQAQVGHGWCFHPGDEITKHERGERQRELEAAAGPLPTPSELPEAH